MFLTTSVTIHLALRALGQRLAAGRGARPARRTQAGQASAEYALVLLGCAAVAILVTTWATKTNKVGALFDGVMEKILDRVK